MSDSTREPTLMTFGSPPAAATGPRPGSDGEDFGLEDAPRPTSPTVMLREFLPAMLHDVLTGEPPPEYRFDAKPWGTLALRPREITCIGGAPNCGKTALMLRITTGALLMNPEIRAVYGCVEMDERILMERTLARLSGVYLGKILKRARDRMYQERIESARPQLESLADRLMFIRRPLAMVDVLAASEQFRPHIVVLDYLQRIPADRSILELRQQVTQTMTVIRLLADTGPAVLLVAALNRQASSQSQARARAADDNVNDLAAFRDSSDVEYSVDDAYVLTKEKDNRVNRDDEEYTPKNLILRHVKSRNSLTRHIPLTFDGRLQEFTLRSWDDPATPTFSGIAPPSPRGSLRRADHNSVQDPFSDLLRDDPGATSWLNG